MPWKEANKMDQRAEFALRSIKKEKSFKDLCAEYDITPKTGQEWRRRFLANGHAGMGDLSRRPHSSPTALSEDLICQLVLLKLLHSKWGPNKIRDLYIRSKTGHPGPSLSSVKRILGKVGLVEKRRRVRRPEDCGRFNVLSVPGRPNDLWTVDFKGWWYCTGNEKVVPLTVRDAYSRFVLLVQVVPDGSTATVRACFERLFEKYGLPLNIRSDNGSPFASRRSPLGLSRLSAWFVAHGINLERTQPGHPEQNGGHERMHRDIATEVQGHVDGNLAEQQAALELWQEEFNHIRPHEALGMRTPSEVYLPSERRYDPLAASVDYPKEYLRRKVSPKGIISMGNRKLPITAALAGWEVGLQPLDQDNYIAWFGTLRLGSLNVKKESFAPTM